MKAATLHRSDFVQQNAANTKTNIYQLKSLYNNHSHNHRKYEGLNSINKKYFLRQDKKFIMIEYKH